MKNSPRLLVINTVTSYGRTLFGMVAGLLSMRWVYQALGPVDFGLMGVVGALIVFVTFINSVSEVSCSRFYAFSIGKGSREETNDWFNIALAIHTIVPGILVAAGWFAGDWAIQRFFNIPPQRMGTAVWVFRMSLVSALTSMFFSPYLGMYKAKQRIYEVSLWGMGQSILLFLLAYTLTRYHGDAWLLYSAGSVGIMVSLGAFQVFRARSLFPECRVQFDKWGNRERLKELLHYCGWQFFGVFGAVLRGQGIALLLNKYFPPHFFPSVNASYAVGNQVSKHTQTISAALIGAFTPEITSAEGGGDRERMLSLADRASKFATCLMLAMAVPLGLEVNYVLDLWLKTPPDKAGFFCLIMLGTLLLEKLTIGQKVAVQAQGRIAGYMLMNGGFLILTLPVAWVLLHFHCSERAVGWAFLLTAALLAYGRILWAARLLRMLPLRWLARVLIPCTVVGVLCLLAGLAVKALWPQPSFLRLCALTLVTLITWALGGWFIACDSREQRYVLDTSKAVLRGMTAVRS